MDELREYIRHRINLNSGGFSSPEVESLSKVFEAIVDQLEDLDTRVDEIEEAEEG